MEWTLHLRNLNQDVSFISIDHFHTKANIEKTIAGGLFYLKLHQSWWMHLKVFLFFPKVISQSSKHVGKVKNELFISGQPVSQFRDKDDESSRLVGAARRWWGGHVAGHFWRAHQPQCGKLPYYSDQWECCKYSDLIKNANAQTAFVKMLCLWRTKARALCGACAFLGLSILSSSCCVIV